MSKGTITIYGHDVQIVYDASIGDDHQESTLQYIARRIADGDTEGEMIESRWRIVNPEADMWKDCATALYLAIKDNRRSGRQNQDQMKEAIKQYKQLKNT